MSALSDVEDAIRAYVGGRLDRRALYRAVEVHRGTATGARDGDPLGRLCWRTLSLLDERGYGHRTTS